MAGVNKVILLGNLGKDPEIRNFETGRSVTNFPLATSETYKNRDGEKVTKTEWHNVVLWSPLSEIAGKYLTKGDQVYIEGRITTRSYEDKEGVKKYITEVVGREMTLLGKAKGADSVSEPSDKYEEGLSKTNVAGETEPDDLPF